MEQQVLSKELEERKKEKENSLWNNSMITSALNSMSHDELEHYKKIGESMFGEINFETAGVTDKNNIPLFLTDAASYICESLKSGLHPSMLTDNEKCIMENVFGKEWYKKYDYVEEDLIDVVTLKKEDK
jgi:hypothetical protein